MRRFCALGSQDLEGNFSLQQHANEWVFLRDWAMQKCKIMHSLAGCIQGKTSHQLLNLKSLFHASWATPLHEAPVRDGSAEILMAAVFKAAECEFQITLGEWSVRGIIIVWAKIASRTMLYIFNGEFSVQLFIHFRRASSHRQKSSPPQTCPAG